MTDVGAATWRRLLARRRSRVLLIILLVAIAVRAALPAILRRVVVAQADQAMIGRIEIDDLDLALLTGGITLHGLRVFATKAPPADAPVAPAPTGDAAPSAGEGPPGSAPVLSATRLMIDLGYVPLMRKTVEFQRIECDDPAVSIDRAKDGTLVLPAAAPAPAPEEPPASEGSGWGVLIQSVGLRGGRIGFRDFAISDPAQHVEVALPTLDADHLALLITQSGVAPGTVKLEAGIQDGTLQLEATLGSAAAGPTYESHLRVANVPIADSRLYIPKVGWSGLTGRLDLDLVHRFESQGAHTVRGTLGLRDLDVRVADLDEPALAWRTLAVDVANVDFVAQHADVTRVALDGARVVTRPAGPHPLPMLRGLQAAAADAAQGTMPAGSSPTVDTETPRPWTWAIATALVTDANIRAIGGDGPLDVDVAAEAGPLASAKDTHTNVQLTLTPERGSVALKGALTVEPLGFDGTLTVADLALAPLTQPVATAATRLLKNGAVSLDLAIAAGVTPKAPPDGVRVSGTLALADLDVAGEDPTAFGLRWQRLEVALSSVTAAGVLARDPAATSAAIDVALGNLKLVRPDLTVTRTPQGIALPAALGASDTAPTGATTAPAGATPPPVGAGAAPAPPAAPSKPPLSVQVRTDRLAVEKMRLAVNDSAVKPFYRSTFDPIDLGAADVRWPEGRAKDLKLAIKSSDGAALTVTGNVAPEGSKLVAKLTGLPIAPFNPYAAGSGYSIGGGTAQLDSTIKLGPGTYDTKHHLVLHQLDVRGGEGDTLFLSRFGMPLSLALSLLTDLQGNIVLDLPIAGDAAGMRTGLGTLIGNAMVRAILNAVTSPLKLLGAVAHIGDKPASLTPQPIGFLAGRETMADGEDPKLAQLAGLLAKAPGLRLHIHGEAGDDDRRWLAEQALRAKLEGERGVVGALRHIGERGPRAAVLTALTARANGQAAEVPAEHREWFEKEVAAQRVDDAALRQLAAARATSVQTKLASSQGIDGARLVVDDPFAGKPAARSVVAIGLGSPAPRPET